MTSGRWVSLFSGGKDSSWALYRALQTGLDVARLVTVHPETDSYMYHVPATELAGLAAESIGIPLVDVTQPALEGHDSGERGDAETETLETALGELAPEIGGIRGVVAGAVESEFQTSRIEAMCERLDADLYAPLWREDPVTLGESMLEAGFEIYIVQVAAGGLDESWVGRRLDATALGELRDLNDRCGVHILGEGGEFETLVTDAPHMDHPIEFEAETVWEGTRGHLEIADAWLGDG
ncbi:MAG: diphthine--ammonia ligase [Halobacteriota archaeon]